MFFFFNFSSSFIFHIHISYHKNNSIFAWFKSFATKCNVHLVIRVSMLSYSCLISQIKHESHEIRSSLIYMYSYLPAVTLHFSDIFYTQIVIKFLDKSNNILNVSFDNSGLTLYIHIYYICILSWFGFFWQWSKCEKIVTVCVCVCVCCFCSVCIVYICLPKPAIDCVKCE